MSFPSTVPGIAAKFVTANLAANDLISVPGFFTKFIANKFIVANFAADLAANDLISVSALPCVFGADCKVVAASVGLLAVVLLLALPC